MRDPITFTHSAANPGLIKILSPNGDCLLQARLTKSGHLTIELHRLSDKVRVLVDPKHLERKPERHLARSAPVEPGRAMLARLADTLRYSEAYGTVSDEHAQDAMLVLNALATEARNLLGLPQETAEEIERRLQEIHG